MTKKRFAVWGLILVLCTGTAGMTTAYAADKTISSVKLQIYTDLEVGDRIGVLPLILTVPLHRVAVLPSPDLLTVTRSKRQTGQHLLLKKSVWDISQN